MTTPSTPARIRKSAAAELRELAANILILRYLIPTLLRIDENPHGAGTPLGPLESVYYARIGETRTVVLYTVDEDQAVTIERFTTAVTL